MIEQNIRASFQSFFVDPVALVLMRKVKPNTVTWLAGAFGLSIFPVLVFFHNPWLAVTLLAISGYFDTLDGTIARMGECTSEWGAVLDIVMDRVVEVVVILSLFMVVPESRGLACVCMLSSILLCVTSFLVVGVFSENNSSKGFFYSPGLMERAEAFLFFSLMMLYPPAFTWLGGLFSVLVMYTAVVRVVQFRMQALSCRLESSHDV